ncbi:hypothetical protein I312_103420 [Cryptococcus bacillisporus CA1280]|uniref:uncharacterized protein n=1 Tax=Cryptococcus bacillisporus CA1280 TaxID=1296109 RepID=UPI003365DFE3
MFSLLSFLLVTRTFRSPPQSPYIRLWTSTFGVVAVLKRTGSADSQGSIIHVCNIPANVPVSLSITS